MGNAGTSEHGRNVVARWRLLAERRLNYLLELHQSGRWTLYYEEPEFLRSIQEARAALKTWEQLAPIDPVQDKSIEVGIAQTENTLVPASPFTETPSPAGIETEDDLRRS